MSGFIPKLPCRKRLRSCDSPKRSIQGDDEEEKVKKPQNGNGEVKNMKTPLVFLEKEKEKIRPNNNSSSEKKTRINDHKEMGKIYNERKNGKPSPLSCRKKDMRTVDDTRERIKKRPKYGNCPKKIHDKGDVWEENHMCNCDSKMKDHEMTATTPVKEQKKKRPSNTNSERKWLQSGVEEKKHKQNLHCKMWNGESSATFFEKENERKRLNLTNSEKKVQRHDNKNCENYMQNVHHKVKRSEMSAASFEKEAKKKSSCNDSFGNKINGVGRTSSHLFSNNNMHSYGGKQRTKPISSTVKEKETRPCESADMKMRHSVKQKKRNVPSYMSKEKKTNALIDSNCIKRKREESGTLFKKKVKDLQSDGNNKKIHSGQVKEKNCGDGEKKKRNTLFSFFKCICNNFKESLSIPPTVAPELEDLINHNVYLEDSEGKVSKIRLSVVDGSLAFHQGWNIFVTEHLLKWGDFLLFEYTAKSTFSVRIFGINSLERHHFDVGRKREGVRKKEMCISRSYDDWISVNVESDDSEDDYYFSGEYPRNKEPKTHHVTVHRNGNKIIRQCRTQGFSALRRKEKQVILITDSESSIHENDVVKPVTWTAGSDTQHMGADTSEDHNRVQSGIENGQPDVVGDEEGRLPDVECGTKCASPKCSKKEAVSAVQSGNGSSAVVDNEKGCLPDVECGIMCISPRCSEKKAASTVQSGIGNGPSAVVNDQKGCLPDVECRTKYTSPKGGEKRAASTVQSGTGNGPSAVDDEKGCLPHVECETKCTSLNCSGKKASSIDVALLTHGNDDAWKDIKLNDSDEDLRRKQEIHSIDLECTTAVNKYTNNGKMCPGREGSRKCEAPAGFRCLEKWRNGIVSDRAVLDGTSRLIKPVSTQEADSKFVAGYVGVRPNPDDKCFWSKNTHARSQQLFTMPIKEPSHSNRVSKEKHDGTEINHSINDEGAVVKLWTEKEQMKPVGSNVNRPGDNVYASLVTAYNCGTIGLDPVRSEGICAFFETQPTVPIKNLAGPDRISKCGGSRTDVNDDTDGNGTTVKLESKMSHLEPVGSILGTQGTNIPVCANSSAAHQSEQYLFNQEDRKSVDLLTPVRPEILGSDDHCILKVKMEFCIPNTTQKWLELPKSLSNSVTVRPKKLLDRNIIMLKDPMKRLWPVFYHENSIFVGFTAGWKPFAAANNLQIGDFCELFKEPGHEEPVYSVQITKK